MINIKPLKSSVKLITVATHLDGYMPWLKMSCERYSTPLIVLGYNEKWQGYAWKFKLMLDYLKKLDSNDLVCFIDAYDVLLLRPLDEIEEYYNKIVSLTNKKIIIAEDISISNFVRFSTYLIFDKCKNTLINSGTYIGKRDDIIIVLENIMNNFKSSDNDQVIITKYIVDNPEMFYIDCEKLLFLTINHPMQDILDNKDIHINNNNLEYFGNKPFFIHGNANTLLDKVIQKLNYEISDKDINKNFFINFKNFMVKAKYYILILIQKYIIYIILFITLVLYAHI